MWRSWLRVLCLAGGVSAAGCADHGSYQVKWVFADEPDPNVACGAHGVDSIQVTGTSTGGDNGGVTALCVKGLLTHEVPVGTWTFVIHQVNARGQVISRKDDQGQPIEPTETVDIPKDATVPRDPVPVMLTPLPECSDGIDNDDDGRVDLDDPDCAQDGNTAAE